jgi:hypothetical protein
LKPRKFMKVNAKPRSVADQTMPVGYPPAVAIEMASS